MFFVSDTEEHKRRRILEFARREPMIAVLLAAANFEWTVGRCILFFGRSPNVHIRKDLENTHGLKRYADLWKAEICQHTPSTPPVNEVVRNWDKFSEAFQMRHRLIHGRGTCSAKMAVDPINQMLSAVSDLYAFAAERRKDLNTRAPIRRKPKLVASGSLDMRGVVARAIPPLKRRQ